MKSLKLAKQFVKAQAGYTVAEVEAHYEKALRDAKTPAEYASLLEEHRRIKAGHVASWMIEGNRKCENCGEPIRYHVGTAQLCKNPAKVKS